MKKTLIVVGVIAAVVAVVMVRRGANNDAQPVSVEAIEVRDIRSSILATGKLSHEQEVKLSTEVIGRVSAHPCTSPVVTAG